MKGKTWLGVAVAGLTACAPSSLDFTVWGEALIEQGIPASAPADEPAFVDGWSVTFERFLVTLKDVRAQRHDGSAKQGALDAGVVFDLVKPGPKAVVSFTGLPSVRFDEVAYAVAPAPAPTAGPGVSAEDVALVAGKASVHVTGRAVKGGVTKRFAWSFDSATDYVDCEDPASGGKGAVAKPGMATSVELTIHGDHLFYDDVADPDAKLRFEPLAAADTSPADGVVTLDELKAVNLTALPLGQYGTGSAANVKTLADFVGALTRSLGHFQGEGHCTARAR